MPESEPLDITVLDDQEDEPTPPRSRARRVLLGTVLAVALAVVAAVAYVGWQIGTQNDATLSTPQQIGSLSLDQTEDGKSTADYLQTALAAEIDFDHTVGAVYSATGGNVLFFGGTTLIMNPSKDLNTAFGLISDSQGAVTGLHEVPAGRFGGTMKCGTTKSDDGELVVCGWADHGSLALAMFPGRSEDDSATLLREIRDATQKR